MSATRPTEIVPRWQRPLLPGSMLAGPGARRTARDWAVDSLMLLLAIAIGLMVLIDTWPDHDTAEAIVDIGLGVIALGALWWRRSRPVFVGYLICLVSMFSALAGGAVLVTVFNTALRTSGRHLAGILALAVGSVFLFPLLYPGEDGYATNVVFGLLLVGIGTGWGLFVRVRRDLITSLQERAERLEGENRLRVEQAREAERRRIAREMHDVLAHRVSLVSLHAGALEYRSDASPEQVAKAAGVIRASAHAAQEELREVIGVMREGPEAETGPPQPTLAEIPALIEESRAAGMKVELDLRIEEARNPPDVIGRTAYRVVQEGLTNARKHAPHAAATVTVSADPERGLVIEVSNRQSVAARGSPGSGEGLIGLAERVGLAGGELSHGADGGGNFVLRATLPWSS